MNRFFKALGILCLVAIISQQALAEEAIFDSESQLLTIPSVQINESLYSVTIKVATDGALSLIDMRPASYKENEQNDDESLLYTAKTNPLLYLYMAFVNHLEPWDENSEPIGEPLNDEELEALIEYSESDKIDIQAILESTKWSKESVPGVYTDTGYIGEFTFDEDGTGFISCSSPMEPILCQQDPVPFVWTIDSYGNLVFGTNVDNILFRFVWVLLKKNDEKLTIYCQDIRLPDANNTYYSHGSNIKKITKQ